MSAKRTTKSLAGPGPGSTPPSELVAARLSLMRPDPESSELSPKVVLITLSSLILSLQANVLSRDVWALSVMAARKYAAQAGVSEDDFGEIMLRLEESRQEQFKTNPMSCMF